jgi:hypothetical protein
MRHRLHRVDMGVDMGRSRRSKKGYICWTRGQFWFEMGRRDYDTV